MARLIPKIKEKDGKRVVVGFQAEFYDPHKHPRRKRVTLRTRDEQAARQKLAELERMESRGEWDPRKDAVPDEGLTLGEAVKRYVRFKRKQGRRPSSVRADESVLNLLVDSLRPGFMLRHLEQQHIEKFLDRKRGEEKTPLSAATRHTYHTRIRSFIQWCQDENLLRLHHDPTRKVPKPKLRKREKPFMMPHEFERLIRAVETDALLKRQGIVDGEAVKHAGLHEGDIVWLKDVLTFAYETGLRRGEIVHARWSWVNLYQQHITIQANPVDNFLPKSHHERMVPLKGRALEIIRRLHAARTTEADSYIFAGQGGEQLDGTYLSKRTKKYLRLAKLSPRLTFHSLRHSYISLLVMAGVPLPVVQRLAGHADITTTMGYAHLAPDMLHDAVARVFGSGTAPAYQQPTTN